MLRPVSFLLYFLLNARNTAVKRRWAMSVARRCRDFGGGGCVAKQYTLNTLGGSPHQIVIGAGMAALWLVASPAPGAWINMGGIARGEVSLLIDTVPAGGALTVTFNIVDAAALTPTVGTPDMQFQLAVRRPLGGPNITGQVDGTPSTPNLTGPESIPFTEITWTFIQIPAAPRPGGTQPFSGTNVAIGTNPMTTLTTTGGGASYAGGELRFSFTPSRIYLQGSYTGTVVFTATRT